MGFKLSKAFEIESTLLFDNSVIDISKWNPSTGH